MPDHLGDDMRKVKADEKEEEIKCLYFVLFSLFSFAVYQLEFDGINFSSILYLQLLMKAILNC